MAELAGPFHCRVCGRLHAPLPLSFSVKYPQALAVVAPQDVDRRIVMTPDQCVLDGTQFFLRGRVVVPVRGVAEPFIWGVWAEVSPKNFLRTQQLWTTPGREAEPPFPGWLNTDLPLYGTTLNLPIAVHTQIVGRRPHFTLSESDHPLAQEQHEGISRARVEEIASFLLHSASETGSPGSSS